MISPCFGVIGWSASNPMTLQHSLEQIDARDDAVRAWTYIDRDALPGIGVLAGMVLGVKDVIDVKDMPKEINS